MLRYGFGVFLAVVGLMFSLLEFLSSTLTKAVHCG